MYGKTPPPNRNNRPGFGLAAGTRDQASTDTAASRPTSHHQGVWRAQAVLCCSPRGRPQGRVDRPSLIRTHWHVTAHREGVRRAACDTVLCYSPCGRARWRAGHPRFAHAWLPTSHLEGVRLAPSRVGRLSLSHQGPTLHHDDVRNTHRLLPCQAPRRQDRRSQMRHRCLAEDRPPFPPCLLPGSACGGWARAAEGGHEPQWPRARSTDEREPIAPEQRTATPRPSCKYGKSNRTAGLALDR